MSRTFCTIISYGQITMLLYLSKHPKQNPQQEKVHPDCDIQMHTSIFLIRVFDYMTNKLTKELTNTTVERNS